MSTDENKKFAVCLIESFNSKDVTELNRLVDKIYASENILPDPDMLDLGTGSGATNRFLQELIEKHPDIHVEVQNVLGEEDKVGTQFTVYATNTTTRKLEVTKRTIIGAASSSEIREWLTESYVVPLQPQVRQTPPAIKISESDGPKQTGWADYKPELIYIPPGEFWMGSDDGDKNAWEDEKPRHRVNLDEYWIGRYPVTVSQYLTFVEDSHYCTQAERNGEPYTWRTPYGKGSDLTGKSQHPVRCVAWVDALEYCRWLARITRRAYCLPSEAEWQKAARGIYGRIYPWGMTAPDRDRCNINSWIGDTTPVGANSPLGDSPYGCSDMAGNVFEWTRSKFQKYPYIPGDGREKIGNGEGSRVLCGGSWFNDERRVRCACRSMSYPFDRYSSLGFRVAVSPSSAL